MSDNTFAFTRFGLRSELCLYLYGETCSWDFSWFSIFLDFLWFFEILFSILLWWQAAPKKPINISWTLALVNPQSSQWDAKQSHGKTPPAWISPQDCGGNQMSEKIITRGSFPGVSSPCCQSKPKGSFLPSLGGWSGFISFSWIF